jgi:hypothetical protein
MLLAESQIEATGEGAPQNHVGHLEGDLARVAPSRRGVSDPELRLNSSWLVNDDNGWAHWLLDERGRREMRRRSLPVSKGPIEKLSPLRRGDIPHNGHSSSAGAEVAECKPPDLLRSQRPHRLDAPSDWTMVGVTCREYPPIELVVSKAVGLHLSLCYRRQTLPANPLDLVGREGRGPDHLCHEVEHPIGPLRQDGEGHRRSVPPDRDAQGASQLLQLLGEVSPGAARRPPLERIAGESGEPFHSKG